MTIIPELGNHVGICRPAFMAQHWTKSMLALAGSRSCGRCKWNRWSGSLERARRAGVLRIIVNGSFVADAYEPNDVDCALLIGPDYPTDSAADAELQNGLLFIQAELLTQDAFDYYVSTVFGSDRRGPHPRAHRGLAMNLESHGELEVTREKLHGLDRSTRQRWQNLANKPMPGKAPCSLKRTINQLKGRYCTI